MNKDSVLKEIKIVTILLNNKVNNNLNNNRKCQIQILTIYNMGYTLIIEVNSKVVKGWTQTEDEDYFFIYYVKKIIF